MHVEPPGPHVHRGQAAPSLTTAELRLAATAGAAALVVTGRGDAFLLGALLALAAADVWAGAVAVTLVARWGTSSLPAIAGAQAVLGPAVVVEPVLGAAALLLAAASLVLLAPPGPAAPVFGAAAGIVLAGPSLTGAVDVVVRLAAIAAGGALAWWVQPRLPDQARRTAPVVAGLAVMAAVVA